MKKLLKKIQFVRNGYSLYKSSKAFFKFSPLQLFKQYAWFLRQSKALKKMGENPNFKEVEFYPCLFDNLDHTPLEPTYFFQDTWAAKTYF